MNKNNHKDKTKQSQLPHLSELLKDIDYIQVVEDARNVLYIAKSEIFNKTGQVKAVDATCKTLLEYVDINKVNVVDANIICSDITLKDISDIVTQVRSTLNNVDVFAHVIRKEYYKDELEVHLIASK